MVCYWMTHYVEMSCQMFVELKNVATTLRLQGFGKSLLLVAVCPYSYEATDNSINRLLRWSCMQHRGEVLDDYKQLLPPEKPKWRTLLVCYCA